MLDSHVSSPPLFVSAAASTVLQLAAGGSLTLVNLAFEDFYSSSNGGVIVSNSGTVTLSATNVLFEDNRAANMGGAVFLADPTVATFTSCTFEGEQEYGGQRRQGVKQPLMLKRLNEDIGPSPRSCCTAAEIVRVDASYGEVAPSDI
jgi:hypothetical protein